MPEILLLLARYLALVLLAGSILLILARWRYPQAQEQSPKASSQWREIWRLYKKSRSKEKERQHNVRTVRRRHVLVVDPDEKSARVLVWRLEQLGCTVHRARNGAVGLNLANTRRTDVVIADALLSDVSASDFYRSLPAGLPVVFVGATDSQRAELRALGKAVACLGKPFDPEDAVAKAGRLLRIPRDLSQVG